ncbi:MAG: hypothetical protein EAY69_03775 [Cytophagales bacterium]|nr:MAG: hypothetical protein EAY69_03775 [Cytophagales bacterium]
MKYLFVYLLSSVKFFMGPVTGRVIGLHWAETILCTVLGMMTTVIVLSFIGKKVKQYFNQKSKKRKIFTPRKRKIVRIWKKYGMWGIACLTPLLFTPIGGTLIAVSFGEKTKNIIYKMFVFCVIWALFFTFLVYFIQIK